MEEGNAPLEPVDTEVTETYSDERPVLSPMGSPKVDATFVFADATSDIAQNDDQSVVSLEAPPRPGSPTIHEPPEPLVESVEGGRSPVPPLADRPAVVFDDASLSSRPTTKQLQAMTAVEMLIGGDLPMNLPPGFPEESVTFVHSQGAMNPEHIKELQKAAKQPSCAFHSASQYGESFGAGPTLEEAHQMLQRERGFFNRRLEQNLLLQHAFPAGFSLQHARRDVGVGDYSGSIHSTAARPQPSSKVLLLQSAVLPNSSSQSPPRRSLSPPPEVHGESLASSTAQRELERVLTWNNSTDSTLGHNKYSGHLHLDHAGTEVLQGSVEHSKSLSLEQLMPWNVSRSTTEGARMGMVIPKGPPRYDTLSSNKGGPKKQPRKGLRPGQLPQNRPQNSFTQWMAGGRFLEDSVHADGGQDDQYDDDEDDGSDPFADCAGPSLAVLRRLREQAATKLVGRPADGEQSQGWALTGQKVSVHSKPPPGPGPAVLPQERGAGTKRTKKDTENDAKSSSLASLSSSSLSRHSGSNDSQRRQVKVYHAPAALPSMPLPSGLAWNAQAMEQWKRENSATPPVVRTPFHGLRSLSPPWAAGNRSRSGDPNEPGSPNGVALGAEPPSPQGISYDQWILRQREEEKSHRIWKEKGNSLDTSYNAVQPGDEQDVYHPSWLDLVSSVRLQAAVQSSVDRTRQHSNQTFDYIEVTLFAASQLFNSTGTSSSSGGVTLSAVPSMRNRTMAKQNASPHPPQTQTPQVSSQTTSVTGGNGSVKVVMPASSSHSRLPVEDLPLSPEPSVLGDGESAAGAAGAGVSADGLSTLSQHSNDDLGSLTPAPAHVLQQAAVLEADEECDVLSMHSHTFSISQSEAGESVAVSAAPSSHYSLSNVALDAPPLHLRAPTTQRHQQQQQQQSKNQFHPHQLSAADAVSLPWASLTISTSLSSASLPPGSQLPSQALPSPTRGAGAGRPVGVTRIMGSSQCTLWDLQALIVHEVAVALHTAFPGFRYESLKGAKGPLASVAPSKYNNPHRPQAGGHGAHQSHFEALRESLWQSGLGAIAASPTLITAASGSHVVAPENCGSSAVFGSGLQVFDAAVGHWRPVKSETDWQRALLHGWLQHSEQELLRQWTASPQNAHQPSKLSVSVLYSVPPDLQTQLRRHILRAELQQYQHQQRQQLHESDAASVGSAVSAQTSGTAGSIPRAVTSHHLRESLRELTQSLGGADTQKTAPTTASSGKSKNAHKLDPRAPGVLLPDSDSHIDLASNYMGSPRSMHSSSLHASRSQPFLSVLYPHSTNTAQKATAARLKHITQSEAKKAQKQDVMADALAQKLLQTRWG